MRNRFIAWQGDDALNRPRGRDRFFHGIISLVHATPIPRGLPRVWKIYVSVCRDSFSPPIVRTVTWILLFLMQDARGQAERVRAAMSASIEQQKASVRQQVKNQAQTGRVAVTPQTDSGAFFATAPLSMPSSFDCDPLSKPQLFQMIDEAAQKEGVDPALVREVARQESAFRPCAVSSKGAAGLMQLMPATQAQFSVTDPFDPGQSLDAGTKLLKQLLDRYNGDLPLALSAYNAGPGRVDKAGGVPDIPETKNYVLSILNHFLQ